MLLHFAGVQAEDWSDQAVGGFLEAQDQPQRREGPRQLAEGVEPSPQAGLKVGEHTGHLLKGCFLHKDARW